MPCYVGDLDTDPDLENYLNASVASFREVGLIEVPDYWEWAFGLRGDSLNMPRLDCPSVSVETPKPYNTL